MSKTLAYLRTSTDKQDLNNQRLEILEYARNHDHHIDDFIEISISTRKNRRDRRIEELLEKLFGGLSYCMDVYRNPEGTPEEKNEYVILDDKGIFGCSLEDLVS